MTITSTMARDREPWRRFRDGHLVPIYGWWFKVKGFIDEAGERALVLEPVEPCKRALRDVSKIVTSNGGEHGAS